MKTNKVEAYLDTAIQNTRYKHHMGRSKEDVVKDLLNAEAVILAEFHGYPSQAHGVRNIPEIRSDLLVELTDFVKFHQTRERVSEEVRNGEFEFDDNKSRDDFIEMISHFVMRVSDK